MKAKIEVKVTETIAKLKEIVSQKLVLLRSLKKTTNENDFEVEISQKA